MLDNILPRFIGVTVGLGVVECSEVRNLFKAFDGIGLVGSVFEGARLLCEKKTSAENQCDDCKNLFHFFVFYRVILLFLI